MRKHLFILSTLVLFAFCSCNNFAGDPITKDFTIEGSYTELQVENAFDITVSDKVEVITVTAGENVMPNVLVEKSGDKLRIHLKPMTSNYGSEMKVVIPYNEDLTRVDLSGASEFHTAYSLMNEEVEVALSGASDFYGDLNALSVRLDMSGASGFFGDINGDGIDVSLSGASNIEGKLTGIVLDLELSGASDAALMGQIAILKIDLSGASDIIEKVVGNKYGLVCDQCEGKVSGGSAAYIHCDSSIEVSLSGGSELHYTGNASTTDSNTSGESGIIHDVLP